MEFKDLPLTGDWEQITGCPKGMYVGMTRKAEVRGNRTACRISSFLFDLAAI
ncbi:MAG: hypothetical protein LBB22_02325 [Treponema sp.]|nr:hypothetical protein [Treponema sp.]